MSHPFMLPENVTNTTEFTTMDIPIEKIDVTTTHVPTYMGFGFYVRNSILITKLGILREVLELADSEVQVKLISPSSKRVVASVTFEPLSENQTESDILLKAIKPVMLKEYSEAVVMLDIRSTNNGLLPDCRRTEWVNLPRVIHFVQLWSSVMPHPYTTKSCTYVSMTYYIADFNNVKNIVKNRNVRLKEWHLHNKKLSVRLNNETKNHNDIILVDVVDVYRNISLKLLNFYKRVLETEYFHYILKTDDDSFIDLLRVYNQLRLVSREMDEEMALTIENKPNGFIAKQRLSKFWWWSFFREFWKVQHFGKWRESQYRSASYPTFPCGGGYVVNKGIVDYIASNAENLNHFQGEDTSMGIWLSSLPVTNYKTSRVVPVNGSHDVQKRIFTKFKLHRGKQPWIKLKTEYKYPPDICQWTCTNEENFVLPSCNKVQLSVKDMYDTWSNYINNGFL
ncbi:hypothetical protein RUM44_012094 [Polyplax serrata]|uniref:Hexosyltransferase n=1 Tax=Polyplax serrata TaxID=468196 RepID=A0ABR1BE51_POLSC